MWTPEDDAALRAAYPHVPTALVAASLRRTIPGIYTRAAALGLQKTEAYRASPAACRLRRGGDDHPGRATQFTRGHVPANKGLRRPGWGPGRMKATQFTKGALPWTYMPVGSTRLIGGYLYRKVSDVRKVPYTVNWKPVHVLLWTATRGPVPTGHVLIFRNGDKADIRLDNLECVTRRALMARNTVHNLPESLAKTVQLLGALTRQINRRTRAPEQDRRPA